MCVGYNMISRIIVDDIIDLISKKIIYYVDINNNFISHKKRL